MLTREEHQRKLAAILEKPEPAFISEVVSELSENYAGLIADHTVQSEQLSKAEKDKQELIQQNMKLFLKIGTGEPKDNEPNLEEKPKKRSFEDLIGKDGHIL